MKRRWMTRFFREPKKPFSGRGRWPWSTIGLGIITLLPVTIFITVFLIKDLGVDGIWFLIFLLLFVFPLSCCFVYRENESNKRHKAGEWRRMREDFK